jgi:hypothetical protein
LKNITSFEWILKCQKAFEELKESLTPKILSQPRENKSMLLYLGVSNQAISLGCSKRKRVYKSLSTTLVESFIMLRPET